MKIIYQQDEKDCGVTCIAMVLSNYKTKIPIYKLREISGTDLHGVSALGIKETLELFGLICQIGQAVLLQSLKIKYKVYNPSCS